MLGGIQRGVAFSSTQPNQIAKKTLEASQQNAPNQPNPFAALSSNPVRPVQGTNGSPFQFDALI